MPKASELEVVVKANLSDFDAGMDKAGKKVDELGTKKTTLKVDSDTKTAESGLENVEKKATEATKPRTAKVDADTKAALSALNSLALKASIGITIPVMVGLGSMLKSAADFEKANNQIQAITDATGGEMAKVSALALQLGRDTVFSAGDAAKGILELTKAGLSLDQAMAAIPGTMALAAAAGIDVGRASEIASNSLNMFSLSADQTGRVADILAATANASSVEIGDVADSLAMAGAVAAAAGIPIEDVAAAIGELGNQGMKGSDAGTSLKQMLLQLEAPTDKARKAMGDLGLVVYDANGKMKPFREIILNLQTAEKGLTQEQRDQANATIFGSDAVRSANILIGQGVEGFDKMSESVNKAGAAEKLANANMKGLSGAIEYFKGTLDSLMIQSGTPWLDMLNGMIRGGADLISKFGDLPAPIQQGGVVLAALAAVAGPVTLAIGATAGAIKDIHDVAKVAGPMISDLGGKIANLAGKTVSVAVDGAGAATKAVGDLAGGIANLAGKAVNLAVTGAEAAKTAVGDVVTKIGNLASKTVNVAISGAEAAKTAVGDVITKVGALAGKTVNVAVSGAAAAKTAVGDVITKIGDLVSKTVDIAVNGAKAAKQGVDDLFSAIGKLVGKTISIATSGANTAKTALDDLIERLGKIVGRDAKVTVDTSSAKDELDKLADKLAGIKSPTIKVNLETPSDDAVQGIGLSLAKSLASGVGGGVLVSMAPAIGGALAAAGAAILGVISLPALAIGAGIAAAIVGGIYAWQHWDTVGPVISGLLSVVNIIVHPFTLITLENVGFAAGVLVGFAGLVASALGNAVASIKIALPPLDLTGLQTSFAGALTEVGTWPGRLGAALSGLPGEMSALWGSVSTAISGALSTAWSWIATNVPTWPGLIGTFLASLPGQMADLWGQVSSAITGALSTAWSWIATNVPTWPGSIWSFLSSLPDLMGTLWGSVSDAITGALQSAWTWISTNVPTWPGAIWTFFSGLPESMSTLWGSASDAITGALTSCWTWISTEVPKWPGAIWSILNPLVDSMSKLWGAISDAMSGPITDAWAAIEKAFDAGKLYAESVWNDIAKFFKDNPIDVVARLTTIVSQIFGGGGGGGGGGNTGGGGGGGGTDPYSLWLAEATRNGSDTSAEAYRRHQEAIGQLASGGIVDRPTLAWIGEMGAEAVIPLRGLSQSVKRFLGGLITHPAEAENLAIPIGGMPNGGTWAGGPIPDLTGVTPYPEDMQRGWPFGHAIVPRPTGSTPVGFVPIGGMPGSDVQPTPFSLPPGTEGTLPGGFTQLDLGAWDTITGGVPVGGMDRQITDWMSSWADSWGLNLASMGSSPGGDTPLMHADRGSAAYNRLIRDQVQQAVEEASAALDYQKYYFQDNTNLRPVAAPSGSTNAFFGDKAGKPTSYTSEVYPYPPASSPYERVNGQPAINIHIDQAIDPQQFIHQTLPEIRRQLITLGRNNGGTGIT